MSKLEKKAKGTCNSKLVLADDFGDNPATFHCGLEHGHDGPHKEVFQNHESGQVVITWEKPRKD